MSTMTLQMPTGYVEIDREEMEYIEGGGTLTVTLTKATQVKVISAAFGFRGKVKGSVAGALLGIAVTPLTTPIGGALIGTAAGTALTELFSWADGKVSGYLVQTFGFDLTVSVSNWFIPTKKITI
ncbi:MAG: hypothetical protein GX895_08115 [Clostridiales bacterium]|nr:hypothetical protein [Clostridiales bacterium]